MTDILITAPTTIRSIKLPRLSFPWRAIAASLEAIPGLIGNALNMAYVDPYASLRRPSAVPDDDLEDRDPNW